MGEGGFRLLPRFGQGDPGLDAEQAAVTDPQRRVSALGMGDAPPGGHPVDVAGADRLGAAEAVAVQDLALEQVGHGGQADVRVRAHVQPPPGQELAGSHLVEEDEGADHLPLFRGQGAADLEPADIVCPGKDDGLDPLRR